jgi:hypothetical protein
MNFNVKFTIAHFDGSHVENFVEGRWLREVNIYEV